MQFGPNFSITLSKVVADCILGKNWLFTERIYVNSKEKVIEGECSKSEFQSLFGYNTAWAQAVQRVRLKNSRQYPCLVGIGLTKQKW